MTAALREPCAEPRAAPRTEPRIVRLHGTLAEVAPLPQAALYELVRVGQRGLLASDLLPALRRLLG